MQKINEMLINVAEWRLKGETQKRAFVPPEGDPAAGGGAPPGGDPSGGGMPPGMDPSMMGGAPPMDPSMMGGAPPMDPSMMGGMPPAAPPAPAAAPAAPGQPGAAAPKPKIDPAFIYLELSRVRKLLTHFMRNQGVDLPPDILDDGSVASVMQGQQPQSQPIAGPADQAQAQQTGLPAVGGSSAVNPMQPAGGEKQGSVISLFQPVQVGNSFDSMTERLNALSALSRSLGRM